MAVRPQQQQSETELVRAPRRRSRRFASLFAEPSLSRLRSSPVPQHVAPRAHTCARARRRRRRCATRPAELPPPARSARPRAGPVDAPRRQARESCGTSPSRPRVAGSRALPRRQVTEQQSLTLVRNLLRTGLSTICYMRDIFPSVRAPPGCCAHRRSLPADHRSLASARRRRSSGPSVRLTPYPSLPSPRILTARPLGCRL